MTDPSLSGIADKRFDVGSGKTQAEIPFTLAYFTVDRVRLSSLYTRIVSIVLNR